MMNPNTFTGVGGGGGATRSPSPTASSTASEGSGKKVRKPYTITKSREIWTDEEHVKFLEALQLFDRDWKKIEEFVGSKTVIQIRSHAQKYFLKVQKNGTLAHVPPPRPKRKATHPYPQNALKSGLMPLPTSIRYQSSVDELVPGYASWDDTSMSMYTALHGAEADDVGSKGVGRLNSKYSVSRLKTIGSVIRGGVPDFPEVYSFLGNLFDPVGGGHGEKLKEMDPITCQTLLLLMNNITSNLCDPDCEPHRKVIRSYAVTIRTGVTAEIQMSDVTT